MMPAEPVLKRRRSRTRLLYRNGVVEIPGDTKYPAVPIPISTIRRKELKRASHIQAKRQVPPTKEKIHICDK
jgi:hypothetical protein